jgi:cytochrome c oxidase cbb3-type subunit 3
MNMNGSSVEFARESMPRRLAKTLFHRRTRSVDPRSPRPRWSTTKILVGAVAALASGGAMGCKPQQPAGASISQVAVAPLPQVSYVLRNPEGPAAGYRVSKVASQLRNPYGTQSGAIEEGRFLYIRMNCAYCHAFDGTGGMGPDLTDNQWRYGSSDADVFETIYRGRAQGMPAWGNVLTEDQIWKLVSYVRSLGGAAGARYAGTRAADYTRKTSSNSRSR